MGGSRHRKRLRLMKVRRENDSLDRCLFLLTPAENPPVIDAQLAVELGRERLQTRHLRAGKSEKIRHVHRLFLIREERGHVEINGSEA